VTVGAACPLCDQEGSRPSWVGALVYEGREFPYVECVACGTIYCDPMPSDELVARMYGPRYVQGAEEGAASDDCGFAVEDPKEPRRVEMAPLHVLLATSAGQRALFERFGLEEAEYVVREVSWPAPARLSAAELRSPRAVALFALRRCSQLASALRPGAWGNRYFYAGAKVGPEE
jgi:Zn ribbon nucleic-acid-binding protein